MSHSLNKLPGPWALFSTRSCTWDIARTSPNVARNVGRSARSAQSGSWPAARFWAGTALLLACCLVLPAAADPQGFREPQAGDSGVTSSFAATAAPSVSAAQAAAWVRRAHGGRVLSVNPAQRGDSLGYRVRVLVEGGRVKTVYVDSARMQGARQSQSPVRTIADQ